MRPRHSLIFLFHFLLFSGVSAFGQTKDIEDSDPEDLFSAAFDMMMEEKYDDALPLWEEVLEERPESPHINYFVGACLHRSQDKKLEGIPHLEKAVENTVIARKYQPQYKREQAPMDAHYLLADLYHLGYRFEEAIRHYKIFQEEESSEVVEKMPEAVERKVSMCEAGLELKMNPENVRIENLGRKVNSRYKDHSPVVNLDETTLYFTSKRLRPDSSNADNKEEGTGEYFEDIYVTHKKEGEWGEPRLLDLNTEEHEATINLSKDERRLFIYKDDIGSGNIYQSRREEGRLENPEKMGDHVNSEAYETHLDISAENDVMYFSSDREGGEGGRDLYQVKKLPTGEWAKPQNLGPKINTPYNEDGPFIHPDGKTLYFSSEGHKTMGGYDIFRTRQKEDGTWEEPENIGYPINSPDDDIYFVTSPDGKRAYYSSDFKGLETEETGKTQGYGGSDLYLLEFPEAEEKQLTLLKGLIRPGNCEDLLSGIQIMVEHKETKELHQQLVPRTRDGRYVATLPPGDSYSIIYLHEDKVFHQDEISVEEGTAYQEIERAIHLDTLDFDCSKGEVVLASEMEGGGEDETSSGEGDESASAEGDESSSEADEKELPMPEPYQRHFGYNENRLTTSDQDLSSFVEKLVERVENSDETLRIRLEASASRVPTQTYENNEELARLRAENAKESLEKELKERGVDAERYEFSEVEQLVQGPEYEDDASKREKYGDHQYVKFELIR